MKPAMKALWFLFAVLLLAITALACLFEPIEPRCPEMPRRRPVLRILEYR
jgi:hypothetical protein